MASLGFSESEFNSSANQQLNLEVIGKSNRQNQNDVTQADPDSNQTQNKPTLAEDLEIWEQSESRKIFGEARRQQLESNLIQSLKLYSEILEFFPDTDVWPLACIQLSDIYLQRKNITASEKVLKRLLRYRSKNGLTQDENTLIAQWDFFEKLSRINDLILWLEKRNDLEKQKLKDSSILETRLYKLARNEELMSLTQLQQLFSAMGYQKSLHALIGLMDNPDFLFSELRLKELMHMSILEEDINLLRRVVSTMQKAGWSNSAHSAFLEHELHPKSNMWKRLWIQLLIDSQMWDKVDPILKKLPQQDWSREILLSSIGQGKWERAFLEFKEMEKWIFSSLTLEDLQTFAKGLQQETNNQPLYEEFFKMIPEGGKRNLLLAILSKDTPSKIKLLQDLKKDSYYDKRAILELGKIYQKERHLDNIKQLYLEIQQKYPDSSEAKELKLILDTMKTLQKVQSKKT